MDVHEKYTGSQLNIKPQQGRKSVPSSGAPGYLDVAGPVRLLGGCMESQELPGWVYRGHGFEMSRQVTLRGLVGFKNR